MTDTRNRDREREPTLDEMIALEDALDQKSRIKGQRNENDPQGLYNRLKSEEEAERAERVRNLTTGQRLLSHIKEFFGRGKDHEYRQELGKAEMLYSQMGLVSKNLEAKITDIGKRKVAVEKQLILDEAELQTNAVIVFHYDRQLADVTARYDSNRSGTSVRSPATTEAMEDVQEITRLRQSLSEVHAENNRLAIRILSGRELVGNLGTQYDQVQQLYQGFEEQRVKVEGHLDLARVHDEAMRGVADSKSINQLYKRTSVAIEVMTGLQKELKLDAIEKLSTDYRVRSPSERHKPVAGKQYWQTLDLFPVKGGRNDP